MQFPVVEYTYTRPGGVLIREGVQALLVLSPSEETLRQAQRVIVSYQQ